MKKLLVLTDFTANASHAEAAALHLAAKLGNGILLYHTLPYIPLIPSDIGGPYVAETASILFEDSKERLIQEADRLRETAVITPGCAADIEEKNGEGSLGDAIADLTADPEIEMIIMGGRSGGAMDHLLTGSDTAAVIRKSYKPVWVIPLVADWDIPKKIVFATDFGAADRQAVDFLLELVKRLGAQLEIVHVIRHGEVVTEIGQELAFREFLIHRGLACTQVFGEDVHNGLRRYCSKNGADMLAMAHGHHSFISRLFRHSESIAAVTDQILALLVFPPGFKNY